MADINSFTFTGRLTQDATVRTLATGSTVLNANVAVNTGYGDYKKTLYIKVQQWGEGTKNVVAYLKKGTLVGGQGELSRSEWESRDSKKYVDFVVDVRCIQILSSKKDSATATSPQKEVEADEEERFTF